MAFGISFQQFIGKPAHRKYIAKIQLSIDVNVKV